MTESLVGFLFKAASSLQHQENNPTLTKLRSYYMMVCNEVTKGYGLPDRHFSSKVRCTRCCVEWRKGTETRVKPIKLSKKQKQRIQSRKATKDRKELLRCNELHQTCTFCKSIIKTTVPKPEKLTIHKKNIHEEPNTTSLSTVKQPEPMSKKLKTVQIETPCKEVKKNQEKKKTSVVNVYNQTKDVFSLRDNKNTISSAIKEPAKVIKNNKRRKDKFAGLCQKAVLASAKLKQETNKKNKLNMFLKPSL